jgi:hypothetical protein
MKIFNKDHKPIEKDLLMIMKRELPQLLVIKKDS